jgi:Zn-dependent peptidase ImmA (M78 family)
MNAIPTRVTVGKQAYQIQYKQRTPKTMYGSIYYDRKIIEVFKNDAARERNTFWHELTHAILHEMGHELSRDEAFVTEFADKLSGAIDSARFDKNV